MRLGVNHIDKQEFLPLYQQARTEALHSSNIKAGFAATGLVPFDPTCVLSLLHTELHTPTPPPPPLNDIWTAETPHNIHELQHQTELIKSYIKRRTHTPPSPTEQALNQLVKGCELVMHSAVILASENEKLRAENARQKKKKAQKRTYIARGGILTVADGLGLIEQRETGQIELEEEMQLFTSAPYQRAPPRCSLCNSLEHNARTCPRH